MTTITMPRRLLRPVGSPPARRSVLIGFAGTLLLGLLLLAGAAVAIGAANAGAVMPGVRVAGIDLAGLTQDQARARLAEQLPALDRGTVRISVGDREASVAFADLGRGYDLDRMAAAAFEIGRDANPFTAGLERLRSIVRSATLPVAVHPYDAEALAAAADDLAARLSIVPLDAAVFQDGARFTFTPSRDGQVVDVDIVKAAVASAADTARPGDVSVELAATTTSPAITTDEARAAAVDATASVRPLDLTIPGAAEDEAPIALTRETLAGLLDITTDAETVRVGVDSGALTGLVSGLAEQIDQEAANARIAVAAGGGLGGVVPGAPGRALDVDASVASLLDVFSRRVDGEEVRSVPLAVDVTEPQFTTAQAEAVLPQMQMVSSWTTYYVPGDGNGWGNNINIPARDIDGRNLYPGEWFSFWDSIGPVTVERGFMYGGVIINGRSVAGGAIGGGICSTSTTIFNAAMRAGLEIGDRMNHYYYIDRYPDGLDATVYMDDSYVQDFTFRNDTDNPIVIRGFGGNGSVTFQIWTVPTGRSVVLSNAITGNYRNAVDTTVVDPSLAPGTSKRLEYPHNGHDVTRYRTVYDADGNVLHQNTWFSAYKVVNGIVAVGPTVAAAAVEPPPSEPAPPADPPAGDAPPGG
jgi:vancomycin resistance protein YoaR